MRDFQKMTVIPSAGFVSVDDEMYQCEGTEAVDVQGTMRRVPADRILAIHWNGVQGHIEGFGAFETFTDRGVVERYVGPWLAARAKAKQEKVEALVRKRQQEVGLIKQNSEAIAYTGEQVQDLEGADVLGSHEVAALHLARNNLDRLVRENVKIAASATTMRHIADAVAEADAAKREMR